MIQAAMHCAYDGGSDTDIITTCQGSITQSELVTKNQDQAQRIRNISDGLTMNIFDIIESIKKIHQIKPSDIASEESHVLSNDMTENNIVLKNKSRLTTILNENKHPIETIYYTSNNGMLVKSQKTSYSIKKMHHAYIYSFVYEKMYDENGNLIVETSFNGNGPTEFHTILHDPNTGHKTHSFEVKDNVITASKYDDEGKLIRAHEYNNNKTLIRKKSHDGVTTTVVEVDPINNTSTTIITDPFNRNITAQYQKMSKIARDNPDKLKKLNDMVMSKKLQNETGLTDSEKQKLKISTLSDREDALRDNWYAQQKKSWTEYRENRKNIKAELEKTQLEEAELEKDTKNNDSHDDNNDTRTQSHGPKLRNNWYAQQKKSWAEYFDNKNKTKTELEKDTVNNDYIDSKPLDEIITGKELHDDPESINEVEQPTKKPLKSWFAQQKESRKKYLDNKNNENIETIKPVEAAKSTTKKAPKIIASSINPIVQIPNSIEYVKNIHGIKPNFIQSEVSTPLSDQMTEYMIILTDGSVFKTVLNNKKDPVETSLWAKNNDNVLHKNKITRYSKDFFTPAVTKPSIEQVHYDNQGNTRLSIIYYGNDSNEFSDIVKEPIAWRAIKIEDQSLDKKSKKKISHEQTKHKTTLKNGSILETNLNHYGQPINSTLLAKDNNDNFKKVKKTTYSKSFFDKTDLRPSIHQVHYNTNGDLKLDINYNGNDLKEFNNIIAVRPIAWI